MTDVSLETAQTVPLTRQKNSHVFIRDGLDFYVEPEWATEHLLFVERFSGKILDPACGSGNIVKACIAAEYSAFGSDIVDRTGGARWFVGTRDFLSPPQTTWPNIICNPPFYRAKGTEAFIRRALEIATGKVAIFTSIKFLAGQARGNGIWATHPPSRIWVLSQRPSCPPGEWLAAGNTASGGTDDWVWLVWDQTVRRGETHLGWLRPSEMTSVLEAA